MNLFEMTALELGNLIAWRKVSATEATQGALERMASLEQRQALLAHAQVAQQAGRAA